mmetsp:Transcript_15957/g.30006  ORF Transcript_15957/g.30006 Transcript_15957/m.30006 type:complete len:271 (+) Transcript_15957:61-873(+)
MAEAADPALVVKTRSAHLDSDPKMKELRYSTRTHEEEAKARQAKEMEEKVLHAQGLTPEPMARPMTEETLRTDGCDEVNRMLHTIATETVDVPAVGSDKKLPASYQSDSGENSPSKTSKPASPEMRMSQSEMRMQWRNKMDNSLRRLMLNVDLDGDDRLRDFAHQARCNHLDKIFDWYTTHGGKEVRKEAQRATAPAFVRYNLDGPVMPGSLRVPKTPKLEKQKAPAKKDTSLPGLSRGVSSPALVAAGTLNVESPATSPCPSPKAKAAR